MNDRYADLNKRENAFADKMEAETRRLNDFAVKLTTIEQVI